jgi:hypothetical protein
MDCPSVATVERNCPTSIGAGVVEANAPKRQTLGAIHLGQEVLFGKKIKEFVLSVGWIRKD